MRSKNAHKHSTFVKSIVVSNSYKSELKVLPAVLTLKLIEKCGEALIPATDHRGEMEMIQGTRSKLVKPVYL